MAAFDDLDELNAYLPRQARGQHSNNHSVLGGALPERLKPGCIIGINATKQSLRSPVAPTTEVLNNQYLSHASLATKNQIEVAATGEEFEVEDTNKSSHSEETVEDPQIEDDEDFFTEAEKRDAAIWTAREKERTKSSMAYGAAPQIISSPDPAESEAVINAVAVVQAYTFLTSLNKSILANVAHDLESGVSEITIDKNGEPKVVPTFAREDLFRYFGIRMSDSNSYKTSTMDCMEIDQDSEDEADSAPNVDVAVNHRVSCVEAHEMLANKGIVAPIEVLEKLSGRVYRQKPMRLLKSFAAMTSVEPWLRKGVGASL